MTDQENDPRVDAALEGARRTEPGPPPGFAASVMRRVSEAQAAFSWRERRSRRAAAPNFSRVSRVDPSATQARSGQTGREGAGVMKKVLLGTAAFGAVVIVAAWVMGFPPANDGTEATVGAANRYQGAQMTSKDVKLGSTDVQAFIQSDVFTKLVRNPDARATLKRIGNDAAFRDTVLNAAFAKSLHNPDVEAAMKDGGAAAFSQPAFLDAMRISAFAEAAKQPAFLEALSHPAFAETMRKSGEGQKEFLTRIAGHSALAAAFADQTARAAFVDKASFEAMRNPAFLEALSHPAFAQVLNQPAFAEALGRPGFVDMLRNPAMQVMRNPAFVDALRVPSFVETMRQPAFLEALRNPAFADAMRNPNFNAAFAEAARRY